MAGPLSAVAESGGCGYVYAREDAYFIGVSDPTALKLRLLEWLAGLIAGVERFTPATPEETEDLAFLRALTERMREVIEQACEVERLRWSAENCRTRAHNSPDRQ
jgi:hypothetical protein